MDALLSYSMAFAFRFVDVAEELDRDDQILIVVHLDRGQVSVLNLVVVLTHALLNRRPDIVQPLIVRLS